jgi:hypothetical protein
LNFTVRWRGLRIGVDVDVDVDVEQDQATYTLRHGLDSSTAFRHHGEMVTVTNGEPLTRPISKRRPILPRSPQPPGREPRDREVAT